MFSFIQDLLKYLALHSGYGDKLNIDNQWVINDVVKAEVGYSSVLILYIKLRFRNSYFKRLPVKIQGHLVVVF